jgi:activator of HSP90 ATPase
MNSIHQEVTINASPQRVYDALTQGERFSKMTGAPAEIEGKEGGRFSCFGGMITGRNVELATGQRVVQAWRAGNWEPGVYSMARFELKPEGSGTRLVFDHTGYPPDQGEHLAKGWEANYWEPLRKALP